MTHTRHANSGFSLLELMVTLAILAIITAWGIPSFSRMMLSYSVTSDSAALYRSLLAARSLAVDRRASVIVCPSANGTVCATSSQIITFIDADGDGKVGSRQDIMQRIDLSSQVSASDPVVFTRAGVADKQHSYTVCKANASESVLRDVTVARVGTVTQTSERYAANCAPSN